MRVKVIAGWGCRQVKSEAASKSAGRHGATRPVPHFFARRLGPSSLSHRRRSTTARPSSSSHPTTTYSGRSSSRYANQSMHKSKQSVSTEPQLSRCLHHNWSAQYHNRLTCPMSQSHGTHVQPCSPPLLFSYDHIS